MCLSIKKTVYAACISVGNVNRCVRTNSCKSPKQYERIIKAGRIMVWLLRNCIKCGEYTLKHDTCPTCGGEVHIPHPAKFSPEDKYARYRRAMRKVNQK